MKGEKIQRRADLAGRKIFTTQGVFEKILHELTAITGGIRAADSGRRQRTTHGIDSIVVEFAEFLGRTFPVRDIGFVPYFPIPRRDLGGAVARDAVRDPLINELGPFRVILRRVGPAGVNFAIRKPWAPLMLIGFGLGREGFGQSGRKVSRRGRGTCQKCDQRSSNRTPGGLARLRCKGWCCPI